MLSSFRRQQANKTISVGKDRHKIRNWKSYNEGLKHRGALNLWLSAEMLEQWHYAGKSRRGGQYVYSAIAIELCLTLKMVYGLALRQTEGFMVSIFESLGLLLEVPNYTTLCRRSSKHQVNLSAQARRGVTDIVVDSTGLKVYGEGEWKVRKHGAGKHRTWMKLHVAVNAASQQIEAVTLTNNATDDGAEIPALMNQIKKPVNSAGGDGAYDKVKVREALYLRGIRQVIPPQRNAVLDKKKRSCLRARDKAIRDIDRVGRAEWKKRNGYHQRSKAETCMFRYKTIIGGALSARKQENQLTEVKIGCKILNIMLQAAKPDSYKVA